MQGAVEYAKSLEFNAHSDYKTVLPQFGKVDANVCPVHYDYGDEGKPFYIRGPNKSVGEANKIVNKLNAKRGEDNFVI